jgi:hypothetical protein
VVRDGQFRPLTGLTGHEQPRASLPLSAAIHLYVLNNSYDRTDL